MKKYLSFIAIALFLSSCTNEKPTPKITVDAINSNTVKNPSSIIRFKGKLIATELFENRLAILDDVQSTDAEYIDGSAAGKRFSAPHHLAISPWGTLLVSNGWGRSILEIDDLSSTEWNEFHGIGEGFHAPHGICSDKDGWIYVADSLNFRIVRFRDMHGKDWQEFADIDKKIGYARQIVCTQEGLWVTNAYEKETGQQRGTGSNVLLITDFESGLASEVIIGGSKITGVHPMKSHILVSVWRPKGNLRIYNRTKENDVVTLADNGKNWAFPIRAILILRPIN